ncbi:hypothetical protein GCM10011575_36440 [Microlunatus endophyticus]|uniref:Uncharacterized protein n=1 Tax=Microlunatus endophyticus TaxID=1716077 RepID=A0A917SDQ3_9ACTN|nr:hypothetical protein [Microlunatus endophyticus]GGL74928.1 hypothetical protein GCM10011575_36440 [Microlunatus endophyticus]
MRQQQAAQATRVATPVRGSVILRNTSGRWNSDAVVDVEVRAGYAERSAVCRGMINGERVPERGGHCWMIIADTVPPDPRTALSPGEVRTVPISADSFISVDVPAGKAALVAHALRQPDLVVASARVNTHGPHSSLPTCTSSAGVPTAPGAPADSASVDQVIVGTSRPVTCNQIGGW